MLCWFYVLGFRLVCFYVWVSIIVLPFDLDLIKGCIFNYMVGELCCFLVI